MRIALTNDIHKPGGAVGLMAERFTKALLEAGHDATLICGVDHEIGPPPADIPHITWDYPQRAQGLFGQWRFFKELNRASAVAFRQWMEAGKGDAWVSLVPPSGYGAWQVGGKDLPFLYIANSPWAQEWLSAYRQSTGKEASGLRRMLGVWPRRRLERKLVRSAPAWMALSPTQLAWMAAEHGRCAQAAKHILEAGVDCLETAPVADEERQAIKAEFGVESEGTLLISSRRLVPRTGVKVLIEAMNELPDSTSLIITGGGPEKPALEAQAAASRAATRIHFTGIVPFERLGKLTAAADFSILPTQELEGFGLSAAEAFAAGTPVVATPVGALSDVVGAFDEALMSRGIDALSLAECLKALMVDNSWKNKKARQRAREYALERFDWQKHKLSFVEIIEKLATQA